MGHMPVILGHMSGACPALFVTLPTLSCTGFSVPKLGPVGPVGPWRWFSFGLKPNGRDTDGNCAVLDV